ncbi:MAG TPA: hypothetical protein VGS19_10555 [Streptosporangiaceae bacterium]|nr:hypothetical protein [Streptosporangiaceae bacterium]
MHQPLRTNGRRLAVMGVTAGMTLAAAVSAGPIAGAALASSGHTTLVRHHRAAPMRAVVTHLDGLTYHLRLGQPAGIKPIHPGTRAVHAASGNTLAVGSGASTEVVTPNPQVFLVFWGSQWSNDPAGAQSALQAFFQGLFGSDDTWGTILDQYCEGVPAGTTNCAGGGIPVVHPTSSPLAGVFTDNSRRAPNRASAGQIAAEAVRAARHFGSSASTDVNAQYVIASASGTHPDGFPNSGFCAYHSNTSASGVGQVAFTNLPYIPDLGAGGCTTLPNPSQLDGYFSTETHEYAETVTDPVPPNGWTASSGSEIGDECVQLDGTETLTTGTFDVQGLWSNADNACVTQPGSGGSGGS